MAFSPKIDNNLQQDSLRVILFRFYGTFGIVSYLIQNVKMIDENKHYKLMFVYVGTTGNIILAPPLLSN